MSEGETRLTPDDLAQATIDDLADLRDLCLVSVSVGFGEQTLEVAGRDSSGDHITVLVNRRYIHDY